MAFLQRALARRRWQALCSRSSMQAFAARSVSHAAERAPRPLFYDDGGESLKAGWLSKEDGAVARYLKLREGSALRQAGEHAAEGKKLQGVKVAGGRNTPRHFSDNVFENVCKDRVFSLLDAIRVAQRTRSVNSVSEDLQELVNAKLKHWHGKVDGVAAMRILQRLDRNISLAQCFYHWIRSQPGFKVHPSHVGVLIKIAGRAKEFAVMEEYLKNFFSLTGKPPDVIEFTDVMKSYAEAQRIDSMLTVYRKMLAEGVAPGTHTFSILIRALVQARQSLEATEIFRSMKKFNCVPDEFVCSEVVGLFGSMKQLSKAEAFLEEMSSGGVPLNSVVYNNLISQYCKVNEAEKALNLFHQMVERDIRPDSYTILLLTDFFFKRNQREMVDVLMNEAERLGIECSRARLYWHVRQGRLSEAEEELSHMKSIGKFPVKACLMLLHGYVKEGLFDSAKSLLETLRDEGGGVDSLAYTMIMMFCLECNTKEGCRTLVDCMEASQHWWHETLTGLIVPKQGIYEEDALWKEVESNLCKLRAEKTEVGNQMVGTTVAFLEKTDSSKRAMRLWKEARRLGFHHTVQSRKKDVQDIDLHELHPLAVKPVLACELSSFHEDLSDIDSCISKVSIVTGWGRSTQHEGRDSSVKNEVTTILKELNSPFKNVLGNRGAFTATTVAVSNWLQLNRTKSFFLLQD